MTATDALYVYGIVPGGTSPGLFAAVVGIGPGAPGGLAEPGGFAARGRAADQWDCKSPGSAGEGTEGGNPDKRTTSTGSP